MASTELRIQALRLAIEAHGGEGPAGATFAEEIVRAAEVYVEFLQGPARDADPVMPTRDARKAMLGAGLAAKSVFEAKEAQRQEAEKLYDVARSYGVLPENEDHPLHPRYGKAG